VVGAGLPRTATESLRLAFATLLGAPVHHLRDIPGHPARLLDWQVGDGWQPLCAALDVPVPEVDFPWLNRREDWLY
jgi:hypothetical protein